MRIRKQFRFLPSTVKKIEEIKEVLPENPDEKKTDTLVVEQAIREMHNKLKKNK
jgi:hypothetical protein